MSRPPRPTGRELYAVVCQFHHDIACVIRATHSDQPCSEEHCKTFNVLCDQARRLRRSHDEADAGGLLGGLNLPGAGGPYTQRPPMSVLLSRVGHLKAFLEIGGTRAASADPSSAVFLVLVGAAALTGLIAMAW